MTKPLRLNLQMFGASASNNTSLSPSSGYAYTLTASFVENSTDTANNTSNITVTATLKANGSYWSTSYASTLEIYWYDNKTGTETYKDSITFKGLSGYYDSKSVSTTFNAQHNNDGTLAGYAKAYFTKGSTTAAQAPPSGNVATSWTNLTTIPRVSGVSCTNINIGDTATVYISRADGSYTDTITYSIGSLSGTLATRTNQASIPFDTSSMKANIFNQMSTSSQTIQGTINIQTYNANGVSVGTGSTTFTLTALASDCKPLITVNLETTDQLSYNLTGSHNVVIKGISSTSIAYTITPRYNATIVTKMAYNYSDNLPDSPITTFNIVTSNFTIRAVDSRFFPNQVTATYSFVNYFEPTIHLEAYRTSPTGSEIKGKFSGTFFNGTFGDVNNSLTLKIKYRVKGTSTWTDLRTLVENTDYTISDNSFYSGTGSEASDITFDSSVFNYQNVYEVAIAYQDEIVDTFDYTTIPKGVPVFNWENGKVNINGDLTISDTGGANTKTLKQLVCDMIYPVGSIYISTTDTTAAAVQNRFGGTWVAFGTGRTLVGMGSNGTTNYGTVEAAGGSETNWHYHGLSSGYARAEIKSTGYFRYQERSTEGWTTNYQVKGTNAGSVSDTGTFGINLGGTTDGNTISIMQPYITVYMWKRTA